MKSIDRLRVNRLLSLIKGGSQIRMQALDYYATYVKGHSSTYTTRPRPKPPYITQLTSLVQNYQS
jgi:hypothetical protein